MRKKNEVKAGIKTGLESLKGKIPGLTDIKVEAAPLASSNADVMLDSTFENEEALKIMQSIQNMSQWQMERCARIQSQGFVWILRSKVTRFIGILYN